jgi:polysaccharide export outer membrane protein
MQAERTSRRIVILMVFTVLSVSVSAQAQTKPVISEQTPQASAANPAPAATVVPPGYVIGADDLLSIRFWSDAQLSADVVVRPDGKISIPLLNDVQAAGLTPEQLNAALEQAASKYIAEPDATVIVREVRSRKVYVLGQVARPNSVALNTDMNVLQVLTAVGGLLEYADKGNIVIVRSENGRERRFKFNYNDVVKGKKVQQNILLQPGDTIIVN